MHYRSRAIGGGPFGDVSFASHFICVQIFQIQFQGRKWTVPDLKSSMKGAELNFLWVSDICRTKYCTNISKTIFVILEVQFHHEVGLSGSRYLELFSRQSLYFHHTKNQPPLRPPSTFSENWPWFWPYLLSKQFMKKFWYQIWVITFSKSAKFRAWEVY